MTSLISGCAETSANFARGANVKVRRVVLYECGATVTRRNTVIWERLSKKPRLPRRGFFFAKARTMSPGASWSMMEFLGA